MSRIVIFGVNPEPWTAPSVAVGRRGGKPFPQVFKKAALTAYQEAVKEALAEADRPIMPIDGPIVLRFYLWRQLPAYKTERERMARKHQADATNMQKALEDACQGILFLNDRDVVHVETWIMEQKHDTEPLIVIDVDSFEGMPYPPVVMTPDTIISKMTLTEPAEPIASDDEIEGVF